MTLQFDEKNVGSGNFVLKSPVRFLNGALTQKRRVINKFKRIFDNEFRIEEFSRLSNEFFQNKTNPVTQQ